ncbi:MAG: hypothetical protein JXP34_10550 [Planctomycetes bacterium]|nr:hypothetical protein [Planctomycetota bacterium]
MSGKSTLLRTVGINIVLAQAGAPVRAASLRLSPLSIGCSIHILDSLRDGQSRFFAEMARLRDIIHLLDNDRSVLFLLDELMHGTNSGDRRIGAEVLLRRLVDAGAIGLVTTHDLALAEIATSLGARAQNAHFTSHFADGCLQFDYRMRPGVVKESNALDIMMAFGLLESPSPRRADR